MNSSTPHREVVDYVRANEGEGITSADISAALALHPDNVIQILKQTGLSNIVR